MTIKSVIEEAAYAAIGHTDCSVKNAAAASVVIADFVIGKLAAAGYVIVKDRIDPEGGIPGRDGR